MPAISGSEFKQRLATIQNALSENKLDALFVYGDEYRKENLRYVCNFWPIFERGACVIPRKGEPIFIGAPEGEKYAREMCAWRDIRNIKDFACVSVPEEIDYPLACFSSLGKVLTEALAGGKKLGIVGWHDIPAPIFDRLKSAISGLELSDAGKVIIGLRLIKSPAEIACLKEAGRQACVGYEKLIAACVPGATERQVAGAAQGAALQAGAEAVNFMIFGSGPRTATIIGRPTARMMAEGDMVMAALAIQYEGYVATVEYPFVIGKPGDGQKRFLAALFEAADVQLGYLKAGSNCGEMVRAVKAIFKRHGLERYDVYPPMHGIGLAEAESPYPGEHTEYAFQSGMCVNSDISLFGHPDGSNRIEEGFVITPNGPESLTPFIRELCSKGV